MSKSTPRGISEPQIREAITQLQEENQEPTTTKIRNMLGTGSFTTIGTVLAKWRDEQEAKAESHIPAAPDSVRKLFQRFWQVAWQSASNAHESERIGFHTERTSWQQSKSELMAELARLEATCVDIAEKLEDSESKKQQQTGQINNAENKLAAADSRIASLDAEVLHLRQEQIRLVNQVAVLSERAATAEARITT